MLVLEDSSAWHVLHRLSTGCCRRVDESQSSGLQIRLVDVDGASLFRSLPSPCVGGVRVSGSLTLFYSRA